MKSSCISYGWKGNWKVAGGSRAVAVEEVAVVAVEEVAEVASMSATCLCNT